MDLNLPHKVCGSSNKILKNLLTQEESSIRNLEACNPVRCPWKKKYFIFFYLFIYLFILTFDNYRIQEKFRT